MNEPTLIEALQSQNARLLAMHDTEKARAEKAEAAVAEMREAFKSFECTICDEHHKFTPECNACLSGEPSACTCCNEDPVDCPCCMEGDYAEGYRKLRHCLSTSCGQGYLSPDKAQLIWPDIGLDPLKFSERVDGSVSASKDRLAKAVAIQQPTVPDQTLLAWRIDVSRVLDELTVMEARWKHFKSYPDKAQRLRESLSKLLEAFIKLNGCYPPEHCSKETRYRRIACDKAKQALEETK